MKYAPHLLNLNYKGRHMTNAASKLMVVRLIFYDVILIGGGSAGLRVALEVHDQTMNTTFRTSS